MPTQLKLIELYVLLLQETGSLPDNKVISSELSRKPQLKKYMKRVMPFAEEVRKKMNAVGVQALNLTLDFNEMDVLSENIVYLKTTLKVSIKVTIQVVFINNPPFCRIKWGRNNLFSLWRT